MATTVQKFASFADAEKAENAYYRSLTPEQRLEILFDLVARHNEIRNPDEPQPRLKRVYRISQLSQG